MGPDPRMEALACAVGKVCSSGGSLPEACGEDEGKLSLLSF